MLQPLNLFDAPSALIVVGGTCLATVLRCGLADARATIVALAHCLRPCFRSGPVRAELAAQVREIRQDGILRAEPHRTGDAEFDEASAVLVGARSLAGVHAAHLAHRRRRMRLSQRAVRTFTQAADLSPVLGLAGTLVSLSQLPRTAGGDFSGAISMAVLTTLYGLLLGNMVFAPLARFIARRAGEEERERQRLIAWLDGQVAGVLPPERAHP